MKIIRITLLQFLTVFIFNSCSDIVEPPDIENPYLEYEWTIDTLRNPNGYGVVPWSMWGGSDSSVWIAGFNLAGQGELFHWDGSQWNRVTPDLGFNYELLSIFGFSENDVYAVGSKLFIDTVLHSEALILKYNGINWQRENTPVGSGLKYIHGNSSTNIWTCGYDGSLYYKTGGIWTKTPFNEKKYLGLLSEPPELGPIYVASNGEVFLMNEFYDSKVYGDTAMFYFSRYSNKTWQDFDSSRLVNIDGIPTGYTFGNKAIWGYSENEIYSAGNAVFKFDGNIWEPVYYDNYPYRDMKGTMGNKIFAVGNHGTINYFDAGWKRIGDFSRFIVDFYSVMPFENKIFIGAYERGVGYVVRGKRKK